MVKTEYMKKGLLIILLMVWAVLADAQINGNKWRVNFSDRNGTPYSLSNPAEYLSARAIARRTAQNISIVENDLPVNPWYIDSVRNTGVTILNPSKWFNCVTIATTDSSKLAKILSFPFVTGIDTLALLSVKSGTPNIGGKPAIQKKGNEGSQSLGFSSALWDTEDTRSYNYGGAYTQAHMLATDYLHDLGFRGEGMMIAVLDAGFYNVDTIAMFDSLWINGQIMGSKDMVTPGGDVFSAGTHGMMVLSTMAANMPGLMVGTAPKASYWLIRTEEGATEYPIEEDNWASGAELADSVGADIINSSLGYTTFDYTKWSHTYADMNGRTARASLAATMAARKGILVVNSAGNSGNNAWNFIGAPADADSILTIGAVDGSGIYANFSSNGPSSDGRVKPSVCAMGQNTIVCTSTGDAQPGNGTSFSSPVMAGSVACFWQANPTLSNIEIIRNIEQSAHLYMNPDTLLGYGIPNLAAANLILKGNTIYNFDEESRVDISPNPFTDQLSIIFYSSTDQSISIKIFDTSGQLVYNKENIARMNGYNYISVKDVEFLNSGVYVIKVFSGKKSFSKKLIKSE